MVEWSNKCLRQTLKEDLTDGLGSGGVACQLKRNQADQNKETVKSAILSLRSVSVINMSRSCHKEV